jgi:hypothetical protein
MNYAQAGWLEVTPQKPACCGKFQTEQGKPKEFALVKLQVQTLDASP